MMTDPQTPSLPTSDLQRPKLHAPDVVAPKGLLISASSSGAGKTTVMLGLLRALHDRALNVQAFKSGPDYIDPAFHHVASGRASFNLDSWAMDNALLDHIISHGSTADLCIAEGSMGLYDGVATRGLSGFGSSAELAIRMGWPVVLVLDVRGQAQSAAAAALGFARFMPDIPFAGVILNRVSSPRHERLIRLGMESHGINVLGALPRRGDLTLPERHLGLVQAVEHPDLDAAIAQYAEFLQTHVDIEQIYQSAASSGMGLQAQNTLSSPPAQCIAIAQDAAFSFIYPHLLESWQKAGADIIPFSPLADEAPAKHADLVWLPGGYPELYAKTLSQSHNFMNGLRLHAQNKPVHGECGGYMVLGKALIDKNGHKHEMAGLLGLVTSYEKRKLHLGYRRAEILGSFMGKAPHKEQKTALRGHEFHYSTILEQPDPPLAHVSDADGQKVAETGSYQGNVSGTFFHLIETEKPR